MILFFEKTWFLWWLFGVFATLRWFYIQRPEQRIESPDNEKVSSVQVLAMEQESTRLATPTCIDDCSVSREIQSKEGTPWDKSALANLFVSEIVSQKRLVG